MFAGNASGGLSLPQATNTMVEEPFWKWPHCRIHCSNSLRVDTFERRLMPPASILITCLSDPSKGPRLFRIVNYCVERGYKVEVISPPPQKKVDGVRYSTFEFSLFGRSSKLIKLLGKGAATIIQKFFSSVHTKARIMAFGHGFGKLRKSLTDKKYDLIIVEDVDMLPFTYFIRGSAAILLDAREYYPRQRENSILFNVFQAPYRSQFLKVWLKKCTAVMTVSPGLAREYNRVYEVRTHLVLSVPNRVKIERSERESNRIKLVHHGGANPNRQLENMIDIFKLLDNRFVFDMYLTGSSSVINKLKRRAKGISRLRILPHVPLQISKYDIGLYYLKPNGFNLRHSLPNKLFEFIQARLAVVIGPSPDMKEVIERFGCGFIAEEFSIESMASLSNRLTIEDIDTAKQSSEKAAQEMCFEKEKMKLDALFDELLIGTANSQRGRFSP